LHVQPSPGQRRCQWPSTVGTPNWRGTMPQPDDYVHPFAEVALANITREYPYAAHHVARSLADIVPAAEKNPAFANSYDWHSSVHMHYLLASLLGTEAARTANWRDEAIEVLSSHLSDMNMIAEADFLRDNPSWERPYGWVWAVELNRVLNASELSELRALGKNTQVLADRSEEHTSELQSRFDIVCRLLLEKKNR